MCPSSPEFAHAAEIVSPRGLEASMSAARGMLAALAGESASLDVVIAPGGPRWYVRAATAGGLERALAQLRAAYAQAMVEPCSGSDGADPALRAPREHAVVVALQPRAETALPLRTDWRNERDPLSGVVASVEPLAGERVICHLSLAPSKPRLADGIRRRQEQPGSARREYDRASGPSLMPLVALMGLGAAVLQGWQWYRAQEWELLAASGAGGLIGLPLLAAIAMRLLRRPEPLAARTVEAKLAAPLVAASLEVAAFSPDATRARALAGQVAAAYRAYDDAAGGGLRPASARRLDTRRRGKRPLLLNTAEAAALWHLPEAPGTPQGVRRTTARRLPPAPGHAVDGIRVGVSPVGQAQVPVHLPSPLLYRNHFILAKTRRGKSTLLRHIAEGLMERVATGSERTALVVVDPHQDLAEAVLAAVPDALIDRTVYLDFAHLDRPIALNLLDVTLFPDRDRTVEHIVVLMNRMWPDNWGPRMEGALRASLSALHEVNAKRAPHEQYTLLDVAPFLTKESFRAQILKEVEDRAVEAWVRDNYQGVNPVLRQQTANPVTSKIGRFTVTQASRLVLGQPRSTFDPRSVLRDGGVLVVNTAVGTLGEGAASLVGATMLNLIGLLIEEQVALPVEERCRLVELVDESSTLGAVEYGRMLSELGKYGASFTLVTQSLAKLDAIDRQLVPTILSNSDGLTVFQASAEDARRLLPELGGDIEVEDVVSLDDFTCYARWWDGFARPPAFTLRVDPPPPADADRVREIARRSAERVGRPREEVIAEITAILAERLAPDPDDGRKKLKAADVAAASQGSGDTRAPTPTGRVDPSESAAAGAPVMRGNNRRDNRTHDRRKE